MGAISAMWGIASRWYVSLVLMAGVGALIGALVCLYAYPGKPTIGVIDIPFTVLTEDSTFVSSEFLDYARRDDDMKAVVIKLTSPGSFGTAGELV